MKTLQAAAICGGFLISILSQNVLAVTKPNQCHKILEESKISSLSYEGQEIVTFLCEQIEEQEGLVEKEKKYSFLALYKHLSAQETKPRAGETARETRERLIQTSRKRGLVLLGKMEEWVAKNDLKEHVVIDKNTNKNSFLKFEFEATFQGAIQLLAANENKEGNERFNSTLMWRDLK